MMRMRHDRQNLIKLFCHEYGLNLPDFWYNGKLAQSSLLPKTLSKNQIN
jgi:hypothetical protein